MPLIFYDSCQYPAAILDAEFSPDFAIRGLHYDIVHGLLFKLDQFHQIQQGTAYRGRHRIEDEELLELYQGSTCIPAQSIEGPQLGQVKLGNFLMIIMTCMKKIKFIHTKGFYMGQLCDH